MKFINKIFVHDHGICESPHVGEGTRVWAFAHVLPGARVGRDCTVCDHVFIENDVEIGDEVTIKCGVQIWDGLRIKNRVFIGPNVSFSNDLYPRSRQRPEAFLVTTIEDDVSIGANATILPGIRIARGAMVGAGAVVTRDVPPYARVVGNPAKIIGYENVEASAVPVVGRPSTANGYHAGEVGGRLDLKVGGCFLEQLPNFSDMRGGLTPLEFERGVPFKPARIFLVYGVSSDRVRGEHAHRECEQFLVAVAGGVSALVDDGVHRVEVRLDNRTTGLYLAPMVWGVQYKFTPDCVVLVIASHPYDANDYIRDYEVFRQAVVKNLRP